MVKSDQRLQLFQFKQNHVTKLMRRNKVLLVNIVIEPGVALIVAMRLLATPEWWGDRPKGRTLNGRGRGGGQNLPSGGHVTGRGRNQVTFANRVFVPSMENQRTEQANYVITDNDRDGVNGLTEQQWSMLKSILNAGKKPSSTKKLSGTCFFPSWIMDTCASHHLT